jgi:hypothetical protein
MVWSNSSWHWGSYGSIYMDMSVTIKILYGPKLVRSIWPEHYFLCTILARNNMKITHMIYDTLHFYFPYFSLLVQSGRSISSKLFVIASGEANVNGSLYYWNFRTSSFKQVACLILARKPITPCYISRETYLFIFSLKICGLQTFYSHFCQYQWMWFSSEMNDLDTIFSNRARGFPYYY